MKNRYRKKSDAAHRYSDVSARYSSTEILVALHADKLPPPVAIDRLERTDRSGLVAAAELSVEQAVTATSFEKADPWISRAKTMYEKVARTDATQSGCDEFSAKSLFALSQLPLVAYLALFGKLPPPALIKPVFKSSVEVAAKINIATSRDTNPDYRHRKGCAGVLAEAGVILLGQRYAINDIGDGSWLPIHSLHSEDNKNRQHHSGENRSWDVTFFTQLGEEPQKDYLVQVKNKEGGATHKYADGDADGITRVHFHPQLTFRSERGHGLSNTVHEFVSEAQGDTAASRALDERTGMLLEILG